MSETGSVRPILELPPGTTRGDLLAAARLHDFTSLQEKVTTGTATPAETRFFETYPQTNGQPTFLVEAKPEDQTRILRLYDLLFKPLQNKFSAS